MKRPITLAALVLAVASSSALAAPLSYKIDTAHSEVSFRVRHFFSKTPGKFTDYSGTVQYDDKNLAASSVDVTIQAASINTNHEKRDADLKSANFFEVEKYPTLTFKSTKIVPGAENKFKIEGNLTIRDVTKPVVLDAEFLGAAPVAIGGRDLGTRAGFAATTTINRKDYGIIWNRNLDQGGTLLGDDVEITLAMELMPDKPAGDAKPAAAKPGETKPGDAKTAEAKPADPKPGEKK